MILVYSYEKDMDILRTRQNLIIIDVKLKVVCVIEGILITPLRLQNLVLAWRIISIHENTGGYTFHSDWVRIKDTAHSVSHFETCTVSTDWFTPVSTSS